VQYEFQCPICKEVSTEILKVGDPFRPTCEKCGVIMPKKFSLFSFKMDFREGWDPGLGKYINTSKQRDQECERMGRRRIKD
jgi:predicted nucleic acid-binding Zn ribbon protein